ncbi:MAG: adenosylcobinamide-phosphate synthase CbiB [Prochlorococcaceae cyanobacterium]|jgi:adenosylcobinamide-phosphate synthase
MGAWLLVVAAVVLDRLVGDPRWCLHPVEAMGWAIRQLQHLAESWAGDRPGRLRLAGGLLTLLVVGGSGGAGWLLERLALSHRLALPLLVIALASALAGRSLEQAVQAVLAALPEQREAGGAGSLDPARQRLAWIVGRDVARLERPGLLRAAAETASENGVDGLFAPLFWMLLGALLWDLAAAAGLVGPLSLAWGFKAASTLDSMLGYRRGRLLWLGTAGARLDDLLTWLPCRLVALSLPLLAGSALQTLPRFRRALREGAPDPSPNAGVSQAAYALASGLRLGGLNHYGGVARGKPRLHEEGRCPDGPGVERILQLSRRLTLLWLLAALVLDLSGAALRAGLGAQ